MSLVNDRSQGGSSLISGSVELLIHRKCKLNDNRGMDAALDEDIPLKMNHYLIFSNDKKGLINNYRSK